MHHVRRTEHDGLIGETVGSSAAASVAGGRSIPRAEPRIVIRAHERKDFPRMCEIWADPAVMRHSSSMGPMSREQASAAFESLLCPDPFVRRSWRFAIVRAADDALLGTIGIDFERFTTAYTHSMVMHREAWGCGFASEAYRHVLAFAFGKHQIKRIWTACSVENYEGRRLIERVGFDRYGTIREYLWSGKLAMDCHTYSLLARDWYGQTELHHAEAFYDRS